MLFVKAFTFNPIQENTYLIYNEEGAAIIIDPGCYFDNEQDMLAEFIKLNHLQIKYLLNTHCHLDHVFGNKWVYETYSTPLHIHISEKKMLEMAPSSGLMWGIPFDNYTGPLLELIPDNQIILGKDILDILYLPGHSPGHLGFYCQIQNFIISGDVLFYESIGRTDLPGGNHAQLIESIKTKLFTLPDNTTVYSGHGQETTIGHEKRHNPFLIN